VVLWPAKGGPSVPQVQLVQALVFLLLLANVYRL
jgi:hypothetical protein